jgi:NAD(P)-dependent dehydrogenase (short-subunit alcohol dehydrogenase family)
MSKVVLVTGASSGIGRATALEFAKRGARLVLGSRGEEAGAALLKELGDVPALFQRTDVAIEADTRALVDLAIERFGRLDVAVNSAALEARGTIEAFDEATYTRVFDANVKGMFFAMKAQIAAMRRGGGGSIVNLSSTGGSRGMPNMAIYVASKHAVEGLSRAAALDLAASNIRVNVVAPGPTLTPMLSRVTDGHPEAFARRVPMGRAGAPEEVARAIVWLASDEASFVSGVVLPVNGGLTAG